jgi:hypothetical protein
VRHKGKSAFRRRPSAFGPQGLSSRAKHQIRDSEIDAQSRDLVLPDLFPPSAAEC